MTVTAKAAGDHIGEIGLIFDHEKAHGAPR
jgi:hypothetical protein